MHAKLYDLSGMGYSSRPDKQEKTDIFSDPISKGITSESWYQTPKVDG